MTDLTMADAPAEKTQVEMTPEAVRAVESLIEKKELNLQEYFLRLYVQDGGCSGYQYGMALDDTRRKGDRLYEENGVKLVVDQNSLQYLKGSIIDYQEDIMHSGFKIENPNAMHSCSCGDSFRTESRRPRGGKTAKRCSSGQ
jgi:iron-sulfur cluster assembly protein